MFLGHSIEARCVTQEVAQVLRGSVHVVPGLDGGAVDSTRCPAGRVRRERNPGSRGYVPTEAEYAATVLSYDLIALRSGSAQTMARATCKLDDTGRVTALKIDSAFARR